MGNNPVGDALDITRAIILIAVLLVVVGVILIALYKASIQTTLYPLCLCFLYVLKSILCLFLTSLFATVSF